MIDRSRPCRPSSPHRDRLPEMAILVNSSDGFQDCWAPFFRLLATHWPSCRFPVYLNVEEATYEHPSLEVRCLNHPRLPSGAMVPWSDRLIESLQAIPEPYVMSMQEDYFLDAPVRAELVEDCLRGVADDGVGCVRLTGFGARGGTKMAERPYLVDVPRISHSRTSTQAAIWDKEVLLSYVRRQETVWETEILGTRRAWSRYAAIRSGSVGRAADRFVHRHRDHPGQVAPRAGSTVRPAWHPDGLRAAWVSCPPIAVDDSIENDCLRREAAR